MNHAVNTTHTVRSGQFDRLWKRLSLVILIVVGFTTVLANHALAQQPTPSDDEVNAIAKQLYCPVCENVPLDVCPTQACEQWRELIREKLSLGWEEDRIKAYFVDQYGARVLAAPPAEGFNWLAYLVPPIAILGGAYVLYRAMRSWQKPVQEGEARITEGPEDEYIQRLEEELRKR